MLVLSRKRGEAVIIGDGPDEIVVVVVDIRPDGKVRLGIDAPREVLVDRLEVRERRDGEGWGPGGRPKGSTDGGDNQ